MKTRLLLIVVALSASPAVLGAAEETPAPAENPLLKPPEPEVTKEEILQGFGYVIGRDINEQLKLYPMFYSFGFTQEDFRSVMKGIAVAFQNGDEPVDLEKIGPQLRSFFANRPEEVKQIRLRANRAEQEEALRIIDARDGVHISESGLRYRIEDPGEGEKPVEGDIVVTHYRGSYIDGTEFESSLEFQSPVQFALNDVIPAWREGLKLIAPGGYIVLYAPADLAYGDAGQPPIPPGKLLVFEIELLAVNPPQAEAADESAAPSEDATEATPETTVPVAP